MFAGFARRLNFGGRSFRSDRRGAVAVTMAVFAAVLLVGAGVSVDMARAYRVKLVLQQSVDQAAAAAAAVAFSEDWNNNPDTARMREVARAYLASSNLDGRLAAMSEPVVEYLPPLNEVSVSVNVQLATTFLRFADIPNISFGLSSTARRANRSTLELVMVLDGTSSMRQKLDGVAKYKSVRTFATGLVDRVMGEDGKIGLVPYSSGINIGRDYDSKPWLDVQGSCSGSGDAACTVAPGRKRFRGCIGSRRSQQDTIESPTNPKYPGLTGRPGDQCTRSRLMDLTGPSDDGGTGKRRVRQQIAELTPNQDSDATFMPGGLVWAWNMLDADEPLTRAASVAQARAAGTRKVMVLLSDGVNSVIPDGSGYAAQSPAIETNEMTTRLCRNMKRVGIEIFVISVGITDPATRDMLKACASNPQQFFDAGGTAALSGAFATIGDRLARPQLAVGAPN